MADDFTVRIDGLTEFRKALKRAGAELPKLMRKEMQEAVQRGLRRARAAYSAFYPRPDSTRRSTGRTASKGIRATATAKGAGIRFGGARYAYLPGQEFGSNKHRQFAPWTGRGPGGAGSEGRAIYPAARAEADEAAQDILKRFDELARKVAPGA